jgi:hypothetical protein
MAGAFAGKNLPMALKLFGVGGVTQKQTKE